MATQKGQSFAADMRAKKSYQPRMTDPVSGQKLVKGQPVPTAADSEGVRNPVVGPNSPFARMKKGSPVPTASSGGPGSAGDVLRAAGQTVADTFFNPKKGAAAKRNGGK
jgi:hypothetical protein